ncbi:deoxyhypusine hydroxylase [Seriola lalandi dorsalis]|uniref:Deoxyhypusine hydroxylase n=1 Tax=Seriola lalandi dorsalis TaxID=1841481 RepID=A0A3B4YJZ9_SERLL|nr:deoxyhypusine hydroxylase [Seriola lalandi dorsalis]XP_023269120.1 deoxyhypusine hydroxylase [Seriola lalandi dorsalis]XP_056234004.1 deoxyhypusine hydroxylase [Seriola aureovittata]XP_056234005.1 deoxyhypusine hydroxylase [Seriola aureovittata]
MASVEQVATIGQILVDPGLDLTRRFRALFTLKNLGGAEAIEWISKAFTDESALLKHELAYCLGQMQDRQAIPSLTAVLKDTQQEPMVRHEAGEALGAIGDPAVLDLLKEYSQDPVIEVAETCQLAVRRLEWLQTGGEKQLEDGSTDKNPYCSVDPAPPAVSKSVSELRSNLLNESLPLFERYRAMFALRNLGNEEAALALGDGLQCSSALFRHEIGYVLGQMQHPAAVPALCAALERSSENPMVRHEAAEALGSIGKDDCLAVLQRYRGDRERVVKESCEVALDMLEYENSDQFQYADELVRLQG